MRKQPGNGQLAHRVAPAFGEGFCGRFYTQRSRSLGAIAKARNLNVLAGQVIDRRAKFVWQAGEIFRLQ
jgi:hypothetical protein